MANIKNSNKPSRYLSWTCVIYPESVPENWQELLGEMWIPWACSPLHDRDLNADGEKKKPHWHLLLSFRSVKTYEQVKEITDKLNAPVPQPCKDTRGLVRYFLHLDNPSKAQYEKKDITSGGGFDVENALKPTATEESEILDEIEDFIEMHWVVEYCDLASYIRHEKKEWASVFRHNAFHLSNIMKSQRYKLEKQEKQEREERKI